MTDPLQPLPPTCVEFCTAQDGTMTRPFLHGAPIELVDSYGRTLAAFRDDSTCSAWGWCVHDRAEAMVRFFAYGRFIGYWWKLAPVGLTSLQAQISLHFSAAVDDGYNEYQGPKSA